MVRQTLSPTTNLFDHEPPFFHLSSGNCNFIQITRLSIPLFRTFVDIFK